ncbi:HNH endonuclease signature motif containing protein [Pseudogemmobacter bohemicus]|uniref:HNH endonuclease signature motif containing protein n=1 Tax=Pseudogemmobacter bohemicus TaxID=2250708 RepID=UPI00130061F1|nr:HNH endonuclease signature motif containing protein [Pseudogemmobacter bohemicus]
MKAVKKYPSQERLRELFFYDCTTGFLEWLPRPREDFPSYTKFERWNERWPGKIAGSKSVKGYRSIYIGSDVYLAHRLVWILNNGDIPDGYLIDHRNGDGDDNRLENLRLATALENSRNAARQVNNTSGFAGVSYAEKDSRWVSRIKIHGKHKLLVNFKSFQDAVDRRIEVEIMIFGAFAPCLTRAA